MKQRPVLGCIADDFTGATDLASFLVASGMRTIQVNGIPRSDELARYTNCDALVIALKSRSEPVEKAVADTLAALEVLQALGCRKTYFKYCSTFDSTPQGNIGPVIDALLDTLGETSTIVCPALPVNGRTVYQGHLFVFGQLLNESSMRNHPVTPMQDANLMRLLEAQGAGKAINIPFATIDQGIDAIRQACSAAREHHRYLITDALTHTHLKYLGAAAADFRLVTGGSGLAADLCAEFESQGFVRTEPSQSIARIAAPTVILSGSCSAMTQQQVRHYQAAGPSLFVDPFSVACGAQTLHHIVQWVDSQIAGGKVPLVYATADAEFVARVNAALGAQTAQALLEKTLAELAQLCVQRGVRNLIVAGGETSGAVVKQLGCHAFHIGETITPGVPIVQTLGETKINLVLKSGNFGQENFFNLAVETLSC